MEITIDNKVYNLKFGFRAMMIYERLVGKTFEGGGLNEIITFFYSCVAAADETYTQSYNDFVNWLDEHPTELTNFSLWLSDNFKRNTNLEEKEPDKSEVKSKKDSKKKNVK